MNNALLYFGGLLVVVFAALFAVPLVVDWNGYRGVFEEEASKVLGRDVRVGGAVNVRFLPTPYVRFEKVRLADPTGQTGESFIRADSFTMRLAGPPLLRGVLEANEIELNKPVLTLALDGKGGGNWSSVQVKPGALPFVPHDVTLRSVKLIDGVIAVYGPEAQPIARIEAINGELSADALKGPFKFKGQATWSGEPRDVKFATSAPDSNGAFQIKANSHSPATSTSYALDGKIEDLTGLPRLTGELTGKIALPGGAKTGAPSAEQPAMELKSRIDASTSGAKIDDILLSLDNAAEQQLITGSAISTWGNSPRLDITLAAKWLDLDRLADGGDGGATFVKVQQLGLSLLHSLAGGGAAGAKIDIDQVKLGGETAGGLKVDAERNGGAVVLKELKAGLPGGSRLDLTGELKDDGGKVSFAGAGFVRGSKLAVLLEWAAKSGAAIDLKADGPFSAEGRVLLDDTRFELTDAAAEVGGRAFSGDVVVSGDQRRRVAVTLEAQRLDSSELFPATAKSLDDSIRRAFGMGNAATAIAPAEVAADPANSTTDISVRILAGELKHGDQTFRNVDATVGLDGGNIRIPAAKFTTASGLTTKISGLIKDASVEPKGMLAYDLIATTPDALKDLATVFGLGAIAPVERLSALGSAKLAGLVHLGGRSKGSADVSVEGSLQSAKISGQAEFDGGLQQWRNAPSRIRVTGKAAELGLLLAGFGMPGGTATQPDAHEAELTFASAGTIATGASALLDVEAPGFEMAFRGRSSIPARDAASIDGSLRLKADDMQNVLAALGLPSSGSLAGMAVDGSIDIERRGNTWALASRNLTVGGSAINGLASLKSNAQGPATLDADLRTGRITVAGLLAPILDKPKADSEASNDYWPDASFNFEPLRDVQGNVRLRFDALQVGEGLAARNGSMRVAFAPGTIAISEMSGAAATGKFSGSAKLDKSPAGADFDAQIKIENADLATLGLRSRGKASLAATFQGSAFGPATMLTVASGSGTAKLDGAHLPVPGPSSLIGILADIMGNKVPNKAEEIVWALEAKINDADTELGSRTIPFVIGSGVTKFDPILIESADGKVSGITTVDLTSLSLSSAWQIAGVVQPLAPPPTSLPGWVAPAAKGPLPPAEVAIGGQLGNLKQLAVRIDAADMQSELIVRQTERTVEMLERLKLEDAERQRIEQVRRAQIEAEKAAAATRSLQQALPPVLPESAGTSAGSAAAPPPLPATTPSLSQSQFGTVTTRNVDLAPVVEQSPASPAPLPAASGKTPRPVVKSQPVRGNPAPRPLPRRTTQDEFIRSLGGFP